ncbi:MULTISPECIES: hypothetical protein [Actinomadura]
MISFLFVIAAMATSRPQLEQFAGLGAADQRRDDRESEQVMNSACA